MDVDERQDDLGAACCAIDLPRRFEHAARRVPRPGRRHRRRLVIIVAAAIGLIQILGGVALAAGVGPIRGISPSSPQGQISGTSRASSAMPGLVPVAQGGNQGYCYRTDLQGPPVVPAGRVVPYTCYRGYGIPMYEADGTTRIGVFWLGGPGGAGGSDSADGSRVETTADSHGTIIITRKSASGRITITRTELRGATTRNTAADDPSLKQLPKAQRTATWRAITLWFRDVGVKHPELTSRRPAAPAWLVAKMSAAARAAGDPAAAARWTLTFRRCAAPLEGAFAPTSDEGKYSVAWIAVLHGDFSEPSSAAAGPAPGGYSWIYLLLDRRSHGVISEGASATPFDTSMFPLQGRTQLH